MAVWVLKGGRSGEYERRMLDHQIIVIGWDEIPDLSAFSDRAAFEAAYRQVYPDSPMVALLTMWGSYLPSLERLARASSLLCR